MTLIVALKYEDGVLVVSDSRVSYGETPLMREEAPKIEAVGKFAMTGVGLAGPLDRIIGEIKTTFSLGPRASFKDLVELSENVMWDFSNFFSTLRALCRLISKLFIASSKHNNMGNDLLELIDLTRFWISFFKDARYLPASALLVTANTMIISFIHLINL